MNTPPIAQILVAAAVLALAILPARADEKLDTLKIAAVKTYTAIAGNSTADAQTQAFTLKKAVAALTASPTADLLDQAKQAWIDARLPYLQSEVFRLAGGPQPDRFDPASVDYLEGKPGSGIINQAGKHPSIDKTLVASLGGKSGGFEAIEFLLWGEDLDLDGPGKRSFEDYVKGKNAAAPRRAQYLNACAELVAEQAAAQARAWEAGVAGNQRAKFLALPADEALGKIFTDLIGLAGNEFATERIGAALETRKNETSQFSDLTHVDMIYGCAGIANVVAGAYVGLDSKVKVQDAGLLKLAEALGDKQAVELKLAINGVMLAVTEFRPPFDRALLAPDDSAARAAIEKITSSLEEFSQVVATLSKALGIEIAAAEK